MSQPGPVTDKIPLIPIDHTEQSGALFCMDRSVCPEVDIISVFTGHRMKALGKEQVLAIAP